MTIGPQGQPTKSRAGKDHRWEGPPENRPRGYKPAVDDPDATPDAANETLNNPDRRDLGDALKQRRDTDR